MVKYIQLIQKLGALLPYLLVSIIAGIISSTIVKCSSTPDVVPVKIELYNHETAIKEIRAKRDSTANTIPSLNDASGYLYDRYNREASANNTR